MVITTPNPPKIEWHKKSKNRPTGLGLISRNTDTPRWVFLVNPDGGAQKADINDQQQRILFNPGGGCIQNVTAKDKPTEDSRHENQANTGNDDGDMAEEIQ